MSEFERNERQQFEEANAEGYAKGCAEVLEAVENAIVDDNFGLDLPEGYCVINMAVLKRQFPELRISASAARRIRPSA